MRFLILRDGQPAFFFSLSQYNMELLRRVEFSKKHAPLDMNSAEIHFHYKNISHAIFHNLEAI